MSGARFDGNVLRGSTSAGVGTSPYGYWLRGVLVVMVSCGRANHLRSGTSLAAAVGHHGPNDGPQDDADNYQPHEHEADGPAWNHAP